MKRQQFVGRQQALERAGVGHGQVVAVVGEERPPSAGAQSLPWDFTDSAGDLVPVGAYIVRITADDASRNLLVYRSSP
jgi:hypothetical protein